MTSQNADRDWFCDQEKVRQQVAAWDAEPTSESDYPSEAVTDPDTGIVYFPDDDAPNPHGNRDSTQNEPHAYAVETLWNRGGYGERWGMAMEMSDYRQPLDREDAEELLAKMVEAGHSLNAVRLVAVAVVATTPAPVCHASEAAGGECERMSDALPHIECPCGRAPGGQGSPSVGHVSPAPEDCMCPSCHSERLTYCRLSRGYPEHQNHLIPECPFPSSPPEPSRCCPGAGSMAHVRGCVNHPEAGR